jgi:membrane protein YqaA with SNARE-associated domain
VLPRRDSFVTRTDAFITDLQEAIPRVTPRRVRALLLLMAMSAACLALLVVLLHVIPQVQLAGLMKYDYLGVFLSNLVPSLSVIVPAHLFFPGQAVNVVVASAGASLLWVAVIAALGSTLGEVTSYYVGYGGQRLLKLERFGRYRTAERWMKRRGWLAVVTFAFLPLFIFDFAGIAAGALRLSLPKFLLFTYLGRLPRAIIEVYFYTWIFHNILSQLPHWVSSPFSG